MNLADIRTRLAGLEGRAYWRSLEELADTPEFQNYVNREFPSQASEFTDPAGRRQFLKLMGASIALAGATACTRQPEEKLVPYVRQPEEVVPGRPLFYATAMPLGGVGMPVLAENHLGRPTKLEGNPEHPASLGATDIYTQASVLGLYDPDRSRTVLNHGEVKTWGAFQAAIQSISGAQKALRGAGLRILSEPVSSPSVLDQIQALLEAMPDARWHQWDPVFGAWQGGAPAQTPVYHFSKAQVIVSLDADFLGFGPGAVRYSKDFSSRRRLSTPQDELNRLYVVEPVTTITGGKADHRLALKAREVGAFAAALAVAVGAGGSATAELPEEARKWVPVVAADLQAHRGTAVVVAGPQQPAAVHALAQAMNEALGNAGTTVTYGAPVTASPADGVASLAALVADMNTGEVDTLFVFGANPVFTAPADLGFSEAFDKVATRVHVGLYHDETAERCQWHVPEAHYLESWGDVRAFDGTVTLQQPLVAPLYDGHTMLEVVAALNGAAGAPMDLVRDYWTRAFDGKTRTSWTLRDTNGQPFASFDALWRRALHDGFIAGTAAVQTATAPAPAPAAPATALATTGMEIVFRPDPLVLDGRYGNNGWLQELPKPISKVTWDNVAYVSFATAQRLGVNTHRVGNGNVSVIEIAYQGRTVRMPVWILPGTADDVVVVHLGYGRRRSGRIGNGLGVDTFPLRTSGAPWFDGGVQVTVTDEEYPIASTQNHFAMEHRHPVRVVDHEEYRKNPASVAAQGHPAPPPSLSLYPAHEYNGLKWGMAIDLNACTGCGVCVAACVAENNIPVVGKTQVMRSREMHWIRVDTYFEGDPAKPEGTFHQPIPCQQCENAPCEVVCPVAATVHSDEGLNDMVYNRCVGTRYCSNNCPYKVRRFNFLLYSDFSTPELQGQRNPDVTIRSRGVMEKCTYCVQRINHARIDAKTAGREIADGEIKTACEQACPADAIVFGNLNDPKSRVTTLKQQERNYSVLADLGTRPRTTYLAVVRNPNPALA
ncbi:MAG TPA: TAT-variant-translocated molybdopterin oxidoreductase [Vicinamibacterales bacterium]|nr:TAT-variant-translocated molybdopterin oxidoreductase [Vicinamibacterales bacterium]